jgi:hypothetical protein
MAATGTIRHLMFHRSGSRKLPQLRWRDRRYPIETSPSPTRPRPRLSSDPELPVSAAFAAIQQAKTAALGTITDALEVD